MPQTKIVCTIGPATAHEEGLRGLIQAGMDVARINFSHGDPETHTSTIRAIRRLAAEEGRLVAVMADLQGPKLRVGALPPEGIRLREGQEVVLTPSPGTPDEIPLPHPELIRDLEPGQTVLLDDGQMELIVTDKTSGALRCRVVVGGVLTSHKGVNVPGASLRFSALTEKDRRDVQLAVREGVDYIALSFVRRPEDVLELRRLLEQAEAEIAIIAKIEKPEALEAIHEIVAVADGVMVARGDLGVEAPAEEVPFYQKAIIRLANQVGKPVITATQMLQSMIHSPRPTRAEASDVANAILDGTDAVMLSGETAVGEYPLEATRTMARIAANAEAHLPRQQMRQPRPDEPGQEAVTRVTDAISRATVELAVEVGARAIITSTISGTTARMVARHRPCLPIIAATPSPITQRRLALVWGVVPLRVPDYRSTDEMLSLTIRAASQAGLVARGDTVVITAGIPFGGRGKTNMLKVHVVGEAEEV